MVTEWEESDKLYFESDASIIKRIGRESISNPIIALVELIKNSYDADASKVELVFENIKHGRGRIRVIDDGEGMTKEELSKKWMTLSIPDKEQNPITKKYNRIKIGEKGIGRMGLEGLSERMTIISRPENKGGMLKLEINWTRYSSGTLLNKIPNTLKEAQKNKEGKGFEIILDDLIDRWDDDKIKTVKEQIELITPLGTDLSFSVNVISKDYPETEGKIENHLLKKYVFYFKAILDDKGNALYKMAHRKSGSYKLPEKNLRYNCGPVEMEFYFFYRSAQKYPEEDIELDRIIEMLESYGGIKLYRDNFLVRLQKEDWLKLDQMRVQNPSLSPGSDQVFGFVKINKKDNSKIRDTTNREGLVENEPYKDLMDFLRRCIEVFKVFRKQAESEKGKKKEVGKLKETKREVKKIPQSKRLKKKEVVLLDFSKQYPYQFYIRLENEINQCKEFGLPNAALILCRKLVENLVYNLLHLKFAKNLEIRYSLRLNKPLSFYALLENLKKKIRDKEFDGEQEKLLKKFFLLVPYFRKDSNTKAHSLIDYLEDVSELEKLKIPEIVQLLLSMIEDIKLKNSP